MKKTYVEMCKNNVTEDQINIYIQRTGANEGLIVEDKEIFEDWFVDDEFHDKDVSEDSKKHIDGLLKTTAFPSEVISEKKMKMKSFLQFLYKKVDFKTIEDDDFESKIVKEIKTKIKQIKR